MTSAQIGALARALAYIIKKTIPTPKSDRDKTERTRILSDLQNAARPLRDMPSPDAPPSLGASPAPPRDAAPPTPEAAAGAPLVLGVRFDQPPSPPVVREGTVAGTPRQSGDPQKGDA